MRHKFQEDSNYTDDMPFGEFIRKKRRILGMSQKDFGQMLGVTLHTVSQWELGVTSPPIEMARNMIIRLGGHICIVNDMLGTPECPLGYCPHQE